MERIYSNQILYIVVPCYNEEAVILETTKRLTEIIERLVSLKKISSESVICFVDDGSTDKTWDIIVRLHADGKRVVGIKLAGNVGHQNALLAGLFIAKEKSDIVVTIDADLQDDVNAIERMVECFSEGYDIVYGVRKKRTTDTLFKKWTALGFYKLMSVMGVKSVYNHADFRLMSKRAVSQLCFYRERNLFLRGMVPLLGYKSCSVYYDRAERFAGVSKYPLGKMVDFAVDGITSFSVKPVRVIFFFGLFFLGITICMLAYILFSYFNHNVVPGWASLMLSVWFCSGCVLMGLGVVGEYIGKIYIEVKNRPRYNIETVIC